MKTLIATLALLIALPANAQDIQADITFDGNQFLEDEGAPEWENVWLGLIAGISLSLMDEGIVLQGDPITACIASDITLDQLYDVVLRYVKNHPEIRHSSMHLLTMAALATAFPCTE